MVNQKKIELFVDLNGSQKTSFPLSGEPIEIGSFKYEATRMGGAPIITSTVMYPSCLDTEWDKYGRVYGEFRGEKYYLKQTPTSSYSNDDSRYKHEIELVSERVILDNVYFYDAVRQGEIPVDDKPLSNSTKFTFFGDIHEFANRLSASLKYSNLDYTVEVDDNVSSEEVLLSFEDQFFSNAIQEAYNKYEVPYYFVGKTIHFGYTDEVFDDVFRYGVDNELLSITKTNQNFKKVNRVTGKGSTDNIPYYYPNNSTKGVIEATSSGNFEAIIVDNDKYSDKVGIGEQLVNSNASYENFKITHNGENIFSNEKFLSDLFYQKLSSEFIAEFDITSTGYLVVNFESDVVNCYTGVEVIESPSVKRLIDMYLHSPGQEGETGRGDSIFELKGVSKIQNVKIPVNTIGKGYSILFRVTYVPSGNLSSEWLKITYDTKFNFGSASGWMHNGKAINLSDVGLKINGEASIGDTITQTLIEYINTSENLMPSIYRETKGAERFYNAINYPFAPYEGYVLNAGEYISEDDHLVHNDAYRQNDGTYYNFANPFIEGEPKEHIVNFEDIKPTIKEATNDVSWIEKDDDGNDVMVYQRIDMFSEFAYDKPDNDETYEDEDDNANIKFKHSYFFAKLRKLPFNLFDHAIENQPMTISFTSGDCGACKFKIGVTDGYPQYNPVQINEDGTLKRDSEGRVICGVHGGVPIQDRQQDTTKEEVWIALQKEEETYGILMPKAPDYDENGNEINAGHRPKACEDEHSNDGDTFVVLGINLPDEYIYNSERNVEKELIKYMKENNEEKFSFDIDFSRIYFSENEQALNSLSENSRVRIEYNDNTYLLYVRSYSYEISSGDILPKISVQLDENLSVNQNALQNAISEVKTEVGKALSSIDVLGMSSPFFLRKDVDDEAQGIINFKKGIKFGEGGKVEILDNNSAKLSIEFLEVTKKATFTSLEIQEKTHVGGQLLVTPAAINCGEVEELEDSYRCYFQTIGEEGEEIFNQFAVGDFAICQTYNTWGSRYYWREVVGVGDYYIDLSKTLCDEGSDTPIAGDKIIQLGNKQEASRQNAIVIAAYGDGSPYIIQYKGINSFEIGDDKIVTKLSSTENIFTGKVHMERGSDGVENLNLEIGGQNLLRNSGFTGDYLSEQLADDKVLEAAAELYSSPLDHWQDTGNINVVDSTRTTSGKEVELDGVLSQNLFYKTELGSNYVLSFMAKGDGSIVWTLGTQKTTIELGAEWAKYESTIEATSSSVIFIIEGQGDVIIGDLKLEKGNVATSWSASPLDNASDRAYYQSMKYLQDAMSGATDIDGGLILTSTVKVGKYNEEESTFEEHGGINGITTDESGDNDVAFWAGGNFDQAIDTLSKYNEDPRFKPTEEQLATMANFVVSHGGKAILNEAIVRGSIYANEGNFGEGCTIGDTVRVVKGGIEIDTHIEGQEENSFTNGKINLSEDHGFTSISNVYDVRLGGDGCSNVGFAIGPHDTLNFCPSDKTTMLISAEPDDMAINIWRGSVGGLRTRSVYIKDYLDPFKYYGREVSNILFPSTGSYEIDLDNFMADTADGHKHVSGQELWLETMGAIITVSSSVKMWSHMNGRYETNHTFGSARGVIRFKYYGPFDGEPNGIWTYSWVEMIAKEQPVVE